MNFHGIIFGILTFLGIWSGHVLVRKLEYRLPDIQWISIFLGLAGAACLYFSTRIPSFLTSGILALAGMLLIVDGVECRHQEKRVIIGHAPANPNNPRHQRILATYDTAVRASPLDSVSLDEQP